MTIDLIIVDDQALARAGLRMILESQPDLRIVGEGADGDEAVSLVRRIRPEVAILDVRMPRVDGLEATRRIVAAQTATRILILTTFDLDAYAFEALRAGASGFLLKDAPAEDIVHAVRTVARGDATLAPAVTRRLVEHYAARPRPDAFPALATLTARELEVVRLLASGGSNADIGDQLALSEATVKTHGPWQARGPGSRAGRDLRLRVRAGRARRYRFGLGHRCPRPRRPWRRTPRAGVTRPPRATREWHVVPRRITLADLGTLEPAWTMAGPAPEEIAVETTRRAHPGLVLLVAVALLALVAGGVALVTRFGAPPSGPPVAVATDGSDDGDACAADPDAADPDAGCLGDPDAFSAGKRGSGSVDADVVNASGQSQPVSVPAAPTSGFSTQVRLGYTVGDQWEPAIAADRFGHVYMLYAQYGGVPGCSACLSPTQVFQMSSDHGATWSAPRQFDVGKQGWDSQLVVDPVDGRTLWGAWLSKNKSDIVVGKSTDFGATWTETVVDDTNAGTDKPILAVRGPNVYVAYDHTQTVWISFSHDGGATWSAVKGNQTSGNGTVGWSLPGGGTVAPNGDVHFAWAGYTQNGGAKGPVALYMGTSRDGGSTWTQQTLDVSGSPPDCSADFCGWAFLGAQMTMASDAGGTLYALWNTSPQGTKEAPERILFSKSTDRGRTWSPKADVSTAAQGVAHAFPAIVAGVAGDVRIAWMDARTPGGSLWNVYYRSSTNGGATWTSELDISSYVSGFAYIQPSGFEYPFGDYFELAIDEVGTTHAVFGEGLNYDSPGSIWYTRGKA